MWRLFVRETQGRYGVQIFPAFLWSRRLDSFEGEMIPVRIFRRNVGVSSNRVAPTTQFIVFWSFRVSVFVPTHSCEFKT